MRCFVLAFVAVLTLTFPAFAEVNDLKKVTNNPTYSPLLHEDITLSLSATVGVLNLNNAFGEDLGVGTADLRLRGLYRFWTHFSGGDVHVGLELGGFASSDNDGFGGGGLGGNSVLDQKRLDVFGVLALTSRPDITLGRGGSQIVYRLAAGFGGAQRDLLEQEFLLGGFAEADIALRPQGSLVGGFVSGRVELLLEELGRVADLSWKVALGPQLNTTTLLRQVRIGPTLSNLNYGDVYSRNGNDLEQIVKGDLFLGGMLSAQIGPVELTLGGSYSSKVEVFIDQLNGGPDLEDASSAWTVYMGLSARF